MLNSPLCKNQQNFPVQDAAAAAAAVAVASNPERYDFESFARHLQDAAMLIQRQAESHGHVTVLLLRWADDTSTETDLNHLDQIFRTQYNYHTQKWLIPTIANPSIKLAQRLASVLENTRQGHLVIIFYTGHGYKGDDNQFYWAR
jgi:hypothetical protein